MPFFRHLTWVKWKYLVHVSNNPKTLCSSHESVIWDTPEHLTELIQFTPQYESEPDIVAQFLGDFCVCLGGKSFSQRICKI